MKNYNDIIKHMAFKSGKECLSEFNRMAKRYNNFCDKLMRWDEETGDLADNLYKMGENGELDDESVEFFKKVNTTNKKIFSILKNLKPQEMGLIKHDPFDRVRDLMKTFRV